MFNTILENFHIEKIISTVKKNFLYMIIIGVIAAFAAGIVGNAFTYRDYVADVSFYVYSVPDRVNDTSVNQTTSDIAQANRLITSYVQVLKSSTFLSAVVEELQPMQYTVEALQLKITTRAVKDTAIFVVYVHDENPNNALAIANVLSEMAPKLIPTVVKAGGFRVLDAAELPTGPSSSLGLSQIIIIGFAVGFIMAFAFFVLKGLLDFTIRRVYEVEDVFNIPIIGKVPEIATKSGKDNSFDKITLSDDSPFIVKEAYNDIRANMQYVVEEQACPVFVVTSADPGEGKTINAYNIAKSMSLVGKKVLLIDADMRESRLREVIPNEDKEGLADYLDDKVKTLPIVKVGNYLDIIYSSENLKYKIELLSTRKWYEFIEEMKKEYDVIIVDIPCLRLYADALSMSRTSAYFIIMVRENMTKFVRTKLVVSKLESLNANIFGIIYNGISTKSRDYVFRGYKEKADGEKK